MSKTIINDRLKNEINHFSNLSQTWWGARSDAGQKRYDNKAEIFKKMCHPNKNTTILEIGAGYGEFTHRIKDINAQITAIDITPKVVRASSKEFKGTKVKFKVGNASDLNFKENSFNIVCGISILHHLDYQKALADAYRVLKKGGKIFFTEPNLLNPHTYIGLTFPGLRKKMEYSPDEVALIRWNIEKILKRTGFKNVVVKNYDFLHPRTPKKLINLVMNLGAFLENIPFIKEISGSLIIYAKK